MEGAEALSVAAMNSAWAEPPVSRIGRRRCGEFFTLSALGFFARAMSPRWQPHKWRFK